MYNIGLVVGYIRDNVYQPKKKNSNSALFKWSIRVDLSLTVFIRTHSFHSLSFLSFLTSRCSARPESRIPNGPTSRCDDEEEGAQGHLHISSPGLDLLHFHSPSIPQTARILPQHRSAHRCVRDETSDFTCPRPGIPQRLQGCIRAANRL